MSGLGEPISAALWRGVPVTQKCYDLVGTTRNALGALPEKTDNSFRTIFFIVITIIHEKNIKSSN